jgi:hypothetical protein
MENMRIQFSPEGQSGKAVDLSVQQANEVAKESKQPASGSFSGLPLGNQFPARPPQGHGAVAGQRQRGR